MKPTLNLLRLSPCVLLALAASCSSGSSGGGGGISAAVIDESEPNDTTTEAGGLQVGETGRGTVADETDTDFWQVTLAANEVVSIEVFGNRFDQAGWVSGVNAAGLQLFDTDGTTRLLAMNDEDFSWNDDQDTDIVAFRAPAAGTYFLEIDVADAPGSGGDYLVSVQPASLLAPLQFEQELDGVSGTNDTDATAEPITPGTMYGYHVNEESDFYSFTVTEASLVTFTLQAHRNGLWKADADYYDPELNLYDAALNNLDNNDDSFYLDSAIHYLITTPGTYFIEVLQCCGMGDSGYHLEFTMDAFSDLNPVAEVEANDTILTAQTVQFGDFVQGDVAPGNDDYFAVTCNAGDRVYVQAFDADNFEDALDDVTVTIEDAAASVVPFESATGGLQFQRAILGATDTFYVRVSTSVATDYALRFTQQPATFESEPNDAVADAGTFDANNLAAGAIDVTADADMFAFQATDGVPVILNCMADDSGPSGFFELDGFGSNLDPVLTVTDDVGTVLAMSESLQGTSVGVRDGLATVSLVFVAPATGTYYVTVTDQTASFGDDFLYVLEMR